MSETQERPDQTPRPHERVVLGWFREHTDGTLPLPDEDQVEQAARPRGTETHAQAHERVMQELAGLAKASGGRGSAGMTAAGFAIAIAGLLLGAESPVSSTVVAIIGGVALLAFYAGLTAQGFYVGKPLARDITGPDLRDAMLSCEHKEFYATVAMTVAAAALGAEVIAYLVSAY